MHSCNVAPSNSSHAWNLFLEYPERFEVTSRLDHELHSLSLELR